MATNGGYSNPAIQQRPARNVWQAIKSGFLGRCPHCDSGRLFGAFMKPVDQCANCGEEMHHHRSDDLPPYLVIFVVGHIVVGGYLIAERMVDWNSWQHLPLWAPVTVAMAVLLMQPIKGAVIGLQWANYMHGFSGEEDDAVELFHPE